jgi:S-(hydroxymethyl)glutathione dehydrogenase/alcohol dehydrogenase
MKAALLEAVSQPLRIVDDLEIEEPRVGQVRVRVKHCGICHSDLSVVDGAFPAPTPILLGHEAAGIVDAVGSEVRGLQVGDPVILTPCPPCGTCYWCVRNEPQLCEGSTGLITNTFPDGTTGLSRGGETVYRGLNVAAFGEYVVTEATGAVKLADDVPLDVACVIGCAVQTGVGAVLNTARVVEGATVLVLGLGGIGLSVVQGARVAGASRIIVSDPVAARRKLAESFGATDAIDPTSDDVLECVQDLTSGIGVDYAFETAGVAKLVIDGMNAARRGGHIVCVGAPPVDQTLDLGMASLFTINEKKLLGCVLGSCNSLREIPRLVDLWKARRLDLEALITNRRPLDEINEAMDDLRASRGIRTVLNL